MEQGERVGREREEEMEFGAQWGNAKTVMFFSPSIPLARFMRMRKEREATQLSQSFLA